MEAVFVFKDTDKKSDRDYKIEKLINRKYDIINKLKNCSLISVKDLKLFLFPPIRVN